MIRDMSRLLSRTALIAAISYSSAIAVLLVCLWRVSDFEGRAFGLLFIGFPWVLVFNRDGSFFYILALALNVVTVYILVLSLVRILARDSS
jgi:hypothetical protein